MALKYSAVIRSVGRNDFLEQTLASLENQVLPPDEIIIVLPQGVEPWQTGRAVHFYYAERGMVSQRNEGILRASNTYVLLLDDDIVLDKQSALTLFSAMARHKAVCAVPYWTESWPKGVARWLFAFWRIAVPKRRGGISYTAGGGFYYPITDPGNEVWETAGGNGAVIAINRDFIVAQDAMVDMDLQSGRYALREDGAFILRIVRSGGKCIMLSGIFFDHLGGTTRLSKDRYFSQYRASVLNQYIFWRKYIRQQYELSAASLLKARLALVWYITGICFFAVVSSFRLRSFDPLKGIIAGFVEAARLKNAILRGRGYEREAC